MAHMEIPESPDPVSPERSKDNRRGPDRRVLVGIIGCDGYVVKGVDAHPCRVTIVTKNALWQ